MEKSDNSKNPMDIHHHGAQSIIGTLDKHKLEKMQYTHMANNCRTMVRYKLAVLFGFTTVILALLFIASLVYSSTQSESIHKASPILISSLENETKDKMNELPQLASELRNKQLYTRFYDFIETCKKRRRRRSNNDPKEDTIEHHKDNEKHERDIVNKQTACKARSDQCKEILNEMKSLASTASNSLNDLQDLLTRMNVHNDAPLFDFLQCVECQKLETAVNNPNASEELPMTISNSNSTMKLNSHIISQNTTSLSQSAIEVNSNTFIDKPSVAVETRPSSTMNDPKVIVVVGNTTTVQKPTIKELLRTALREMKSDQPVKYNFPLMSKSTNSPVSFEGPRENNNVMAGVSRPQYINVQGDYSGNSNNYDTNPPVIPTAETIKTGQQVQITPQIAYTTVPVCFFGSPPSQGTFKNPSSFPFPYPSANGHYPPQFPPRGFSNFQSAAAQNGPFGSFQMSSTGGYPGPWMPPTGPGTQQPDARSLPYYCTYIQTPTFQLPGVSTEFQRNTDGKNNYSPQIFTVPTDEGAWSSNSVYPGYTQIQCKLDEHQCLDGSICISKLEWCDGRVNCPDASDEMRCSCRDRINKEKVCDGYFDCPRGEDELGCFGCPADSFSCQDWARRFSRENCVPMEQRCDGISQCSNGKDEKECTMLTQTMTKDQDIFLIGYLTGFLHKNYKGKWYPVCTASQVWANDACTSESGTLLRELPRMEAKVIPQGMNHGPYLAATQSGEIEIIPSCNNQALFVKCPPIPCGTRVMLHDGYHPYGIYDDALVASQHNSNANETVSAAKTPSDQRVVGGRASQPQAWPFLAAIYRDGYFHCGAVILDENWILTAAHCVTGHKIHYYEIQAGLLRRFSYAPMAQSRRAQYIVAHPNYDSNTMQSDIALIKLNEPLRFNRWIRQTCLPLKMWSLEPTPMSNCITVGWGAVVEHGPDPDHLREVEVPVLPECKQLVDRIDNEICAGIPEGGRDACQGDSGGPLMCQVPHSESQWYVAGIVSHGEGCGRENEPGVYTRVSKFKDWIDQARRSAPLVFLQNAQCPGFICGGGFGKCIPPNRRCDGIVNCLDAEDEMDCQNHRLYYQSRNWPRPTEENAFARSSLNEAVDDSFPTYMNEPEISSSSVTIDPLRFSVASQPTTEIVTQSTVSFTTYSSTTSLPEFSRDSSLFKCTKMSQSISKHKRCNKIVDCEDGTDEENCTCRDILFNASPSSICDGHIDCFDKTDEEGCNFCREDQVTCHRSGTCIRKRDKCSREAQCPLKEDELDCFALTNGEYLVEDLEGQSYLYSDGIVAQLKNDGVWRPVCFSYNATTIKNIADNLCYYLGLKGYGAGEVINIKDHPLEVRRSTPKQVIPYDKGLPVKASNDSKMCKGLRVKCQMTLTNSIESHRIEYVNNKPPNSTYLWPWEAAIFVNGQYHCPGVLLQYDWVITTHRCTEGIDVEQNYTNVVVGLSPTFLYADGPNQQIAAVDAIILVDSNRPDMSLLHLKSALNFTRNVRSVFYEKLIFPPSNDDECVVIGIDEKLNVKKTFFKSVTENCANCYRCYVNATMENCRANETLNCEGIVVCKGKGGWYPAAVFENKDILCGFKSPQTLTSIDYVNAYLMQAMEKTLKPRKSPDCNGLRCSLGNCISWNQICDGVQDCRDGEDEEEDRCKKRRENCDKFEGIGCSCLKSELKCGNGKCVAKEKFCDKNNDCGDGSDEPANCTCGAYLKLTEPKLVCDNVRHCWDKTDETDEDCLCKDSSFQCINSSMISGPCIPHDFVCDGEDDCENGEDEKHCRLIKGHKEDLPGLGQVLKRSSGVWHSECFPSPIKTTVEARKICRSLNYLDGAVLSSADSSKYGKALVPVFDRFFMVRANDYKSIHMRANKPLVGLMPATVVCHRAFVRCSNPRNI